MQYNLKYTGSSKISTVLAALCAKGAPGESLVTHGVTQGGVSLFGARLAVKLVTAGNGEQKVAEVFDLASICNASALRQSLADCELVFATDEEHKAHGGKFLADGKRVQLLCSAYWESKGAGRASIDPAGVAAVLKDLLS